MRSPAAHRGTEVLIWDGERPLLGTVRRTLGDAAEVETESGLEMKLIRDCQVVAPEDWMREGLEERRIYIEPFTRLGARVSGYWRTVSALEDLSNPRSPTTEVVPKDGARIVPGINKQYAYHEEGKDPVEFDQPEEVARHINATRDSTDGAGSAPRGTAQEVALKDLKDEMADRFEARAAAAVEEMMNGGEKLDTRHFYGTVWEEDTGEIDDRGGPITEERHEWTDTERLEEHQRAMDAMMSGVLRPEGRKPKATWTAGGGGSGKGTLKESGESEHFLNPGEYANVDPDDGWKVVTPEFEAFARAGRTDGASRVHEESSDVAKAAAAIALEEGLDTVVDGVGGSEGWFNRINALIEKDTHDVAVTVVDIPVPMAIQRARERGKKTGRYVDEEQLKLGHAKSAKAWSRIVALPVPVELWDMQDGPQLMATADENGNLTVLDRKLYEAYEQKVQAAGGELPPR